MTKEQLIENIRTAFAETEYPGDDLILYPEWVKNEEDKEQFYEEQTMWKAYKGKRWKDVTRDLFSYNPYPYLFKPHVFAYYLPAFMLFALDDPEHTSSVRGLLVAEILRKLTLPQVGDDAYKPLDELVIGEHFQKTLPEEDYKRMLEGSRTKFQELPKDIAYFDAFIAVLSREQKNIIANFLRYLWEHGERHGGWYDDYERDLKIALERYWAQFRSNED